jgi:hypothetical protein
MYMTYIRLYNSIRQPNAIVKLAWARYPELLAGGRYRISARRSATLPLACSGDIYAAVPRITPMRVAPSVSVGDWDGSSPAAAGSSIAFANPKSSSLLHSQGWTDRKGGKQRG